MSNLRDTIKRALVDERTKLKNRRVVLEAMERKCSISPKLMAEMHSVAYRLDRIEAQISHRYARAAAESGPAGTR